MSNPFDHDGNETDEPTRDADDFSTREEEPKEEGKEEGKETREDKKHNRLAEQIERTDVAEARSRRLEAELAAERVQRRETPAVEREDPFKKSIDDLHEQREQLDVEWNSKAKDGSLTDDDQKRLKGRARKLEEEKDDLQFERRMNKRQSKNSPQDLVEANIKRQQDRYPNVAANEEAWQWADAQVRVHQSENKGRTNHEDIAEIMDRAEERFTLGKYRGTKNRDRYVSAPSGSAPRSSGVNESVRMTKALKQMAESEFAHLDTEKEQHTAWAKKHGKEYNRMEREAGR